MMEFALIVHTRGMCHGLTTTYIIERAHTHNCHILSAHCNQEVQTFTHCNTIWQERWKGKERTYLSMQSVWKWWPQGRVLNSSFVSYSPKQMVHLAMGDQYINHNKTNSQQQYKLYIMHKCSKMKGEHTRHSQWVSCHDWIEPLGIVQASPLSSPWAVGELCSCLLEWPADKKGNHMVTFHERCKVQASSSSKWNGVPDKRCCWWIAATGLLHHASSGLCTVPLWCIRREAIQKRPRRY